MYQTLHLIYADLPGFASPCIVTGEHLRLDMRLSIDTDTLHSIELTVGFETNIYLNAERKHDKYLQVTHDPSSMYRFIRVNNLSISSLRIFGSSCKSFIEICKDLVVGRKHMMHILRKAANIIIRSTFYIFCMRNKA